MTTKVRDVMTSGPIEVEYRQPISDAKRAMRDRGVGSLLVVCDEVVYGMVTDRDLVVSGLAEAKDPGCPVSPLSSTDMVAGVVSLGDLAVAEV